MLDKFKNELSAINDDIRDAIQKNLFRLERSGDFDKGQIMHIFNAAIALSAATCILTFAEEFPNYKSRGRYLNHFKDVIIEAINKSRPLREIDKARH